MVFTGSGALGREAAGRRFDHMLALSTDLPFCKQAVIEESTGSTIGYVGADTFDFRPAPRLEFGYRLVAGCRGRGYATEAAGAVLALARETWSGELLALVDPRNHPSRNVLHKLGFAWVEHTVIEDRRTELYALTI